MTIKHAFFSVRRYGLLGVIDFLKGMLKRNASISKMAATLINDPGWKPLPGITIIGPMSDDYSLSKVLRDFVIRLRECGIPCQAFDTGTDAPIPASEYAHLLTPASEFRLNRYTDIIGMLSLPPLPPTGCRLSRICFWEFESGLCEHHPEFLEPIETVTMSRFVTDALRKQVPAAMPVSEIRYPFSFNPAKTTGRVKMREKVNLNANDFAVFYNFSYRSSYYRKNPEGALSAFAEAFKDCPEAKLVFKTMGAKHCPDYANKLRALVESLGLTNRVVFVDDYLPQDEIVSLTNACDVYLSLHRGEGLGLGIAEAMSLGKPVVVTNYSAPTEFCNADDALPVPYVMRPIQKDEHDIAAYDHVKEWAKPDVHAAAAALRRLYDDRAFAQQLGEKGRRFIADHFSDANFKKSVEAFLARG